MGNSIDPVQCNKRRQPKPRINGNQRQRIRALHNIGLRGSEIAKLVGVSEATVSIEIGSRAPRKPQGARTTAPEGRIRGKAFRCICGYLVYPSKQGCLICAARRFAEKNKHAQTADS
jgi:hypothetical protein